MDAITTTVRANAGSRPRRRVRPGGHRRLARSILSPCLLVLSFALTACVGDVLVRSGLLASSGSSSSGTAQATPAAGERLLDLHGCWSERAPAEHAGAIPAGAVVIPAGAEQPVHGAEWVGPALEHVFEGERPDLTVLGFCAR